MLNFNQEIYLDSLKKVEGFPIERVISYHAGDFLGSPLIR